MPHAASVRSKAQALREKGYSLRTVARKCGISLSTASLWLRGTTLGNTQLENLRLRRVRGYAAYVKARREQKVREAIDWATRLLRTPGKSEQLALLTALWWCEGAKDTGSGVSFTNADPGTIKFFLRLLRSVFSVDEARLRITLHVHEYHDVAVQIDFWSAIAQIPKEQFHRPYHKPHTGIRKKAGYQGCVRVSYGDSALARVLKAAWDIISMGKLGGIVQR